MAKLIVKTTGNFMLIDPANRAEIDADRPTVVDRTTFVGARAALGQLEVLATDVRDDATDAEFLEYFKACDGNETLAVAAFVDAFSKNEPAPAAPEPAPIMPPPLQQVEPEPVLLEVPLKSAAKKRQAKAT